MLPPSPVGQPWPTAATRLFVVFGDPIRHSLSPTIHNAAFRADGLDCIYLAWFTPKGQFSRTLDVCVAAGIAGANVTVPHKTAAFDRCDTLSNDAQLIGAVNTLVFNDGRVHGDNTDVGGFGEDLDTFGKFSNTPVVVFGTGGAARAVVVALGRRNAEVIVVGRRREAAQELALLANQAGALSVTACHIDDATVASHVKRATVVVNASSLGLGGESLPDVFNQLEATQLAYDLIYAPATTPFLAAANTRGVRGQNGLAMLVNQAARAYTSFTHRPAPIGVMRAALTSQLG